MKRLVELTLWAIGAALLGVAFADASGRWSYQEQQERAVFSTARSSEVAKVEPVGPVEMVGPVLDRTDRTNTTDKTYKSYESHRSSQSYETPAPDPNAVGRIEIPRLGVKAIIRKGADDKTLARAVGLVPGTAEPGEAGNVVLAAHRDTFFRPLRKIQVADRIKLVVPPNEYVYEVDSTRIVSPEETSVLQSRGTEELTLVTCYPFGFLGPAPDRFIVSARRVQ